MQDDPRKIALVDGQELPSDAMSGLAAVRQHLLLRGVRAACVGEPPDRHRPPTQTERFRQPAIQFGHSARDIGAASDLREHATIRQMGSAKARQVDPGRTVTAGGDVVAECGGGTAGRLVGVHSVESRPGLDHGFRQRPRPPGEFTADRTFQRSPAAGRPATDQFDHAVHLAGHSMSVAVSERGGRRPARSKEPGEPDHHRLLLVDAPTHGDGEIERQYRLGSRPRTAGVGHLRQGLVRSRSCTVHFARARASSGGSSQPSSVIRSL